MVSKRKFAFVEGTSDKFWEVWVDGTNVCTRYGKSGTDGQTTTKDAGSSAAAQKLHDKLVHEKTRKGYVEVLGETPGPAAVAPKPRTPAGSLDAKLAAIDVAAAKGKVKLPKGASPKAIAAAEKALGVSFPEEVRAFYLRHDGGGDESICDERQLLSLEGMVSEWKVWKQLLDGGDFGANDHGSPDPGVQKKWWIPQWLPVTYDGSGNHHVVDLAPAKRGKVGQILSFWHDDDPRTIVAPDLLTWLAEQAVWGDPEAEDEDDSPPAKAGKPAPAVAGKGIPAAVDKPNGKPVAKLPASLKVDIYADVVAASADLIVAGCTSSAALAVWSAQGGVSKIDKPFQKGLPFRAGPAAGGLATLPGGRFVMASRAVSYDGNFDSALGVFGLDGAPIGKLVSEPGRDFAVVATSPAGDLVAVGSSKDGKHRLAIWRVDDLADGGKPLRVVDDVSMRGLAFTRDGAAVVFVDEQRLFIVPVAKGSVTTIPVKLETESGDVISVSDSGVVCISDASGASTLTLAGKLLFEFDRPCFKDKRGIVVEQAMITPEGTVIATAGDIGRHYARDFYTGVKFPDQAMAQGFVAAFDGKGKLLCWQPRARNKPVRAMALAYGRAVVMGQDGAAEVAPWPV